MSIKKFDKIAKPLQKVIFALSIIYTATAVVYGILAIVSVFSPLLFIRIEIPTPSNFIVYIPFDAQLYEQSIQSVNQNIFILISYFKIIILYVLVAAILWIFYKIIKNTVKHQPFCKENSTCIKALGLLLIGYVLIKPLYSFVFFQLDNYKLSFYFSMMSWGLLVAGFALLTLAEIFRHGNFLQNEHEQTL